MMMLFLFKSDVQTFQERENPRQFWSTLASKRAGAMLRLRFSYYQNCLLYLFQRSEGSSIRSKLRENGFEKAKNRTQGKVDLAPRLPVDSLTTRATHRPCSISLIMLFTLHCHFCTCCLKWKRQ